MKLYLIRHGIAANRSEYDQDRERPLTPKGRHRTKEVAQRLYDIGLRLELILTSPLVRARQTAKILQRVGLSKGVEIFNPLSPGGDIEEWISWQLDYTQERENSSFALVGHQPDLGNWAELLVWGKSEAKLTLKKAGVIGLDLPKIATPLGQAELRLLTSPKWLL